MRSFRTRGVLGAGRKTPSGRPARAERLESRRLLTATLSTLVTFDGSSNAFPDAGLYIDSAGDLFGTTSGNMNTNSGTVFEVAATTRQLSTPGTFDPLSGSSPEGTLVADSKGNLYGTTAGGGIYGDGSVFEVDATTHQLTTIASLNGTNGWLPKGNLVFDSAGNLYGTAEEGGYGYVAGSFFSYGYGTVFEVAASDHSVSDVVTFQDTRNPNPVLVTDAQGNIYGTTASGGPTARGSIFEVTAGAHAFSTFDYGVGAPALSVDSAGNLYGTTSGGGVNGVGAVIEIAANTHTISTLASFDSTSDPGANPVTGIIRDQYGNIFGTTSTGASGGYGAVYEVPAGTQTIKALGAFDVNNLAYPQAASLAVDSSGNLYGDLNGHTTYGLGYGGVFEVTGSGYGIAPPVVKLSKNTTTAVKFGQSVTFTATVIVSPGSGTPTGTVSFMDGSTALGTATLSAGVALLSTTKLPTGSNSVQAVYSGDANFASSTSVAVTQTVTRSSTTTKLTKSTSAAAKFGQSITFTASVSALSPGAGTPTGIVTFEDGSTILGTATMSSSVATFTTSALPVANHSISAVYGSDQNFAASTSAALSQTVGKSSTNTKLTKNVSTAVHYGQAVTFTATVAAVSPGAGTASGIVTFKDGATTLGTGALSGGTAIFTTAALQVGSQSITAVYGGNADFSTSASGSTTQTVLQSATSTKLTKNTSTSIGSGQSVSFTATLAAVSPGAGTPTGIVTFFDSGNSIGSAALSGGIATLTTTMLPVGSNSITAVYGGNTQFTTSSSNAVAQTVTT